MKLDKSRLPYMAQPLAATIESVIFIVRVKNNTATFQISVDDNATDLNRIAEWKLCWGINTDIKIDKSFTLSADQAQLGNLEELMMIVKYVL